MTEQLKRVARAAAAFRKVIESSYPTTVSVEMPGSYNEWVNFRVELDALDSGGTATDKQRQSPHIGGPAPGVARPVEEEDDDE